MNDDAFWGLVAGRRSVRRYAPDPVSAETVEKLLAAAHWAPSAHNRQPWRFVLLNEAATRRRLAEAMAARWQADLLADGGDPAAIARRAALSRQRIAAWRSALDLAALDSYPDVASTGEADGRAVSGMACRICCWPYGTVWPPAGCAPSSVLK